MIGARRGIGGPGGINPLLLLGLALLLYGFINHSLVSPVQQAADNPVRFFAWIIALVLGITVHEFMHAYAAHRLGDDTARLLGRLSLNPMAHLDPFGSLLLVLAGFGYGKPVPFNESRLRSTLGVTVVALAGPVANLALAALCAIPLRFGAASLVGGVYETILVEIVGLNPMLLDGKLNIEAKKPFHCWTTSPKNTDLCAVVEDVRTLWTTDNEAMQDMIAKIRRLPQFAEDDVRLAA